MQCDDEIELFDGPVAQEISHAAYVMEQFYLIALDHVIPQAQQNKGSLHIHADGKMYKIDEATHREFVKALHLYYLVYESKEIAVSAAINKAVNTPGLLQRYSTKIRPCENIANEIEAKIGFNQERIDWIFEIIQTYLFSD